ncbi:hypothetical protein GLOTRDRAFT_96768 [Gloeophyllum trabeum ATCC 11539]|uniref:F-box domain-containing protein n=1 Tax=Gloeophyllum trabeum (strain ATCC 11539 / FP-39264 / Madison 617) TaxID=670483 RepID=S7RED9_GLOTA|nr:uncharacterized protein GLOTRDRAFT_96768 [Gloeophyllum trabeum ATCC 11539]EPQ50844.1 hypothetical protein GLOTRDRAFT_96768 [Gloeophyllum trabeum ATCC 11539]
MLLLLRPEQDVTGYRVYGHYLAVGIGASREEHELSGHNGHDGNRSAIGQESWTFVHDPRANRPSCFPYKDGGKRILVTLRRLVIEFRSYNASPDIACVFSPSRLGDADDACTGHKACPQWTGPLSKLHNLVSYTLCPPELLSVVEPMNFDLLLSVSLVLSRLTKLRRLHIAVNLDSLSISIFASLLSQGQLRSLTFGKVQSGMLASLAKVPDVGHSFSFLREMHIMEMGEVDVNELHAFRPLLQQLTHLTLGTGHKFPKDVLLETVLHVPRLEVLTVFYDNFLNGTVDAAHFQSIIHSSRECRLDSFHELIIQHQGVGTASQFSELFSWIAVICAGSPLRCLEIHSDDGRKSYFNHEILDLLQEKRATMRRLVMPRILIRREVLRPFLQCMELKDVRVDIDRPKWICALDRAAPST